MAAGLFAPAAFAYTEEDALLLARLIEAEAGNQPYNGRVAVANVVLNRVGCERWPDTVKGVIYQKNQFARPKQSYSTESLKAARAALDGEKAVPEGVYFFQRAKVDWFYGDWVCTIGDHNFYG